LSDRSAEEKKNHKSHKLPPARGDTKEERGGGTAGEAATGKGVKKKRKGKRTGCSNQREQGRGGGRGRRKK